MAGLTTIHEFWRGIQMPFTVVPNRPGAKVVLCFVDGEPIEAIVPAALAVHLDRLLELAGGREIRLADETELRRQFPGAEAAGLPPLGPVPGRAVFVDVSLASKPDVVFSAGTHAEAIAVRWADFARTVKPIVGNFAGPPTDRVPAYRLSYRE